MLVAILLPIFVIMAAFAIDLAWMQLVRTELRTATDSASRAGAKTLSMQQNQAAAERAAIDAASRNLVAGQGLILEPGDVDFGECTQANSNARFIFRENAPITNAVKVEGRRTAGSPGGEVDLFFGSVLGTKAFEPVMNATSTVLDRDICLVIDRSGSMGLDISFPGTGNGQNCGPLSRRTRFYALALAIEAFLGELELTIPEEQISLVSYSTKTTRSCSGGRLRFKTAEEHDKLTVDYNKITESMDEFLLKGIGGGTAIGEGLKQGIKTLNGARPLAMKTIVLMTDGRHNSGVTPERVAPSAASKDITVHTVTFSPNADTGRMKRVAELTGGRHFHADTASDLALVFREIARTLPVLVTE
ncbi:von Willebrand factor type A domain protein [Planctomycetes bacterium MalM25]|nr:von Willebrand factor type A domain protein [Planctomycetes bacterium MalM25]